MNGLSFHVLEASRKEERRNVLNILFSLQLGGFWQKSKVDIFVLMNENIQLEPNNIGYNKIV